jgi:non-heme chloroperoxidase
MTDVRGSDGTRIHVQETGEGPPIVFLAGINLSHEVWDREVTRLRNEFRVITVDLRGHGRSDKPPGGYGYTRHAADVHAVLTERAALPAIVVGWSFGGAVAIRHAALYPADVRGLVLVGAAAPRVFAGPDWPIGRPTAAGEAAIDAELSDRPAFRRAVLASTFHRPPSPETLDWLWSLSMRTPSWASVACREAILTEDLRPDLAAVGAPILIVHGRHDTHIPFTHAEAVRDAIPGSRLVPFEDSCHAPHLEEPARFGDVLCRFGKELPSR